MEKEGFVYIWYDRKKTMFYIGCHLGSENDGYICSSNRMRDAFRRRPKDFKRRILKKGIKQTELLQEEFYWLSMIKDHELGKRYYNIHKKHFGHWTNNLDTRNIREKMAAAKLGKPGVRKGAKLTEEQKKVISERTKVAMAKPEIKQKLKGGAPFKGKTFEQIHGAEKAKELKQKISKKLMGHSVSEETKRKISEAQR